MKYFSLVWKIRFLLDIEGKIFFIEEVICIPCPSRNMIEVL